jgi:hypothetical protein
MSVLIASVEHTSCAIVRESTRRTVEENCRTLRFEGYGFEVE